MRVLLEEKYPIVKDNPKRGLMEYVASRDYVTSTGVVDFEKVFKHTPLLEEAKEFVKLLAPNMTVDMLLSNLNMDNEKIVAIIEAFEESGDSHT